MIANALVVCVAIAAAVAARVEPQRPFRSGVLRVAINVTVKLANAPAAGLGVSDFDVIDNGVRQAVDAVARESTPIDVTLVIDTSGSIFGALDRLRNDAQRIAQLLRPADQLRVLTIDTYVHQLAPMQPPAARLSFGDVTIGGTSSVHDGIAAALVFPVPPDRRHLVIVITDARDTISSMDGERVSEIAGRSDAVLHLVLVSGAAKPSAHRPWMPYADREVTTLGQAAERTGGEVHDRRQGENIVSAFRRVFDDFRTSYVLSYNLQGVSSAGWHDVAVQVVRPGNFSVRARRGYFGRSAAR